MARNLVPSITEIYLCDPTGVRIDCLDYATDYEYSLIANTPSPFRIRLPSKFDRSKIGLDDMVEIWRGFGPGTLKLDYCGFLRAWKFGDEDGNEYTELYGLSLLDLLRRRISLLINTQDHPSDDLVKDVVIDTLGADAAGIGGRRVLTNVGGGFTVQAMFGHGPTLERVVDWENCLVVCQDVAKASYENGTRLYFDVIPWNYNASTGAVSLEFRTFTEYRGSDRSYASYTPVYIGPEWDNFINGSLIQDHSEEINDVYSTGDGAEWFLNYVELDHDALVGKSIWNLCEGIVKTNAALGSTDQLNSEGYAYLSDGRPVVKFDGTLLENPYFRYGLQFGFGDLVTISYAGYQNDAYLNKIHVSRDSSGYENIDISLEWEL